ncbi:MAG: hypothetical protein M1820_009812 [Bogoriella megaspora]|nr:MAG: hypothetical protein M1820_009812 [Bogoriella megaspora]
MRSTIALSVLVALAAAAPAPAPQSGGIDFDGVAAFVEDISDLPVGPPVTGPSSSVPTYNPTVAASSAAAEATSDPVVTDPGSTEDKRSLEKRDTDCQKYAKGSAPPTTPDTPDAFSSNTNYTDISSSALVPNGYIKTFQSLDGAVESPSYLGYYTLKSYDAIKCQELCDAASGCNAFNVYIERDPSVNPADACPNPPSTINYKCSLFGAPVCDAEATNKGQWRKQFQVKISGSNGYVKTAPPPAVTNFTGPNELGGAIQAPLNAQGKDTYLGMRMFTTYDPSQCAAVCQSTTSYDKKHLVDSNGNYAPCNQFNVYLLANNTVPIGMYCAMYSQVWGKSYSTNYGQYDSAGNHYTVSSSYSYNLTVQDSGNVNSQ